MAQSQLPGMEYTVHQGLGQIGAQQGSDDRLRPFLLLAEVGGVAELAEEGVVFVRVEDVLVGVGVWSVEFVLLYQRNTTFFLAT